MAEPDRASSADTAFQVGFLASLLEDVIDARKRLTENDTPTNRRTAVRTTFAAIEGMTWLYREHVRFIAKRMQVLTPMADLALRERSFAVTDGGNIVEQIKFVTLPTIVKLTNRQAQLIEPAFSLDFGGDGWSALKAALILRHRITHPKTLDDLLVGDSDLKIVQAAFEWISTSTEVAMSAVNTAFRAHVAAMRMVLNELAAGDEDTIAAYRSAMMRDEDE